MSDPRPPLREDLAGKHLLDRRVLAWLVLPALLASVLTRDPPDVRTALTWVAVNLAAFTLTWLWVEAVRSLTARPRAARRIPVAAVVTIGASLGFVKATATSVFAWAAGLLPELLPVAEWWRAAGTTLQTMFLIPLLTLASATLERYRVEYDRLVTERARAMLLDASRPMDRTRERLIDAFIREARTRLTTAEDLTAATVLERLVEERLRPMTRELWTSETIGTDFRTRSLLRAAVVANPFPIAIVTLVYSLTSLASRAQAIPLGLNLIRTLASAAVLVVVLGVARRLRPRAPRPALMHLVATIVIASALLTFAVEPIGVGGLRWNTVSLLVSVLLWVTVLMVVGGAAVIAIRGGDHVRAELRRSLSADGPDGDVARVSRLLEDRAIADQLHSGLQNRLIAAAHRIAASGGGAAVVREERAAIERLLDDLAGSVVATPTVGAREQFADIAARWDGFVTITSDLDPVLDTLPAATQDRIAQVLIEAVNNAVRHGRAARIDVRLAPGTGTSTFELTVEDDGVGPVQQRPGLGSALFDAMSGGTWALEPRTEGGSRLRAVLVPDAGEEAWTALSPRR